MAYNIYVTHIYILINLISEVLQLGQYTFGASIGGVSLAAGQTHNKNTENHRELQGDYGQIWQVRWL